MKRAFAGLLMLIVIISGLYTVSFAERELVGETVVKDNMLFINGNSIAAAILYRAAQFLGNKTIIKPSYNKMYDDEAEISDWARDSVASMKAMDIMKGVTESAFAPKAGYTVEQAVATMLRLYECD